MIYVLVQHGFEYDIHDRFQLKPLFTAVFASTSEAEVNKKFDELNDKELIKFAKRVPCDYKELKEAKYPEPYFHIKKFDV